jgi:NAD(P)-dependent dehydrogenase (short-subunit alcohol dehydrogenase family)
MPDDEEARAMTRRLEGKVALVFGAGSIGEGWGNGKATAVLYAREGARIAAVDVNLAAAEETCALIAAEGGEAVALAADVVRHDEVARATEATRARFGAIDVLHNNVGINAAGGPVETSEEDWDRVMAVNVKSLFLTCKCVLPVMAAQGRGSIVNISSIASTRWVGYPFVAYAASKAAVNHFTRAIAVQYAPKGIRANVVLPGLMNTPRIYDHIVKYYDDPEQMIRERAAVVPMGTMGDAWDIARASLFLASDEARYITGAELVVDGGLQCRAGP